MAITKEFKHLKKAIKKNFDAALKDTADHINYEIVEAYDSAIDKFYSDYYPNYYDRTGSTYYARDGYSNLNNKFHARYNSGVYTAGTMINSAFIKGKPYRADKDWVFQRTFLEGIHGITSQEQRSWGQNDWWDNYLRNILKIDSKNNEMRINQYEYYRPRAYKRGIIEKEKYTMYTPNGINGNFDLAFEMNDKSISNSHKDTIMSFYHSMPKMKGNPNDFVKKVWWSWKRHPRKINKLLDGFLLKRI